MKGMKQARRLVQPRIPHTMEVRPASGIANTVAPFCIYSIPEVKFEICDLFLHFSYHSHQGGLHTLKFASVVLLSVFVVQLFASVVELSFVCSYGDRYVMPTIGRYIFSFLV